MGQDFNDLGRAAKALLDAPEPPPSGWGDLEPIIKPDDPLPYPVDALPDGIRAAVEEILEFTQAPASLVAGSSLDVLSIACQGLRDVQRAEGLRGPVGTYRLTLAESGERKTTVDELFSRPIREWEKTRNVEMKPVLGKFRAAYSAWESEKAGILHKIKELSKNGKPSSIEKNKLSELENAAPQRPRIPTIIYQDATPEALAYFLSHDWASGAVLSSEAAIFFGSHGMGQDSIMRNLALFNSLWDGADTKIQRRTSESFTVRGARLTMGLATQPQTLVAFLGADKGLARGTGFLARFLLSSPDTTQGTRFFREPSADFPALRRYHRRIETLLDQTPEHGEDGLILPAIGFDAGAKMAWVTAYNEIEADLAPDGELATLRDVASKAGDNIARIAAQFAIYEGRESITGDDVNRAVLIVAYHLHETRRVFAITKADPQTLLAARLDSWLIAQGKPEISKREILHRGPNAIRHSQKLMPILETLQGMNRIRCRKDGKSLFIEINPAILAGEV